MLRDGFKSLLQMPTVFQPSCALGMLWGDSVLALRWPEDKSIVSYMYCGCHSMAKDDP